jgi:hypothetical protein
MRHHILAIRRPVRSVSLGSLWPWRDLEWLQFRADGHQFAAVGTDDHRRLDIVGQFECLLAAPAVERYRHRKVT